MSTRLPLVILHAEALSPTAPASDIPVSAGIVELSAVTGNGAALEGALPAINEPSLKVLPARSQSRTGYSPATRRLAGFAQLHLRPRGRPRAVYPGAPIAVVPLTPACCCLWRCAAASLAECLAVRPCGRYQCCDAGRSSSGTPVLLSRPQGSVPMTNTVSADSSGPSSPSSISPPNSSIRRSPVCAAQARAAKGCSGCCSSRQSP
jgi:hypothetical protein